MAAGQGAGMALLVTHLAEATAALVWVFIEWVSFKKPTLVGAATGTIAGLATVTPASGFIGPMGGFILGLAGGFVCYGAVILIRQRLKIDDSLDVFAVHGVGGMLGILLVPFLALGAVGGLGLPDDTTVWQQFGTQVIGVLATAGWTAVASIAILFAIKAVTGLRVAPETEEQGLDTGVHGEQGYHLS